MDKEIITQVQQPEEMTLTQIVPVGEEQLHRFDQVLKKYMAGKTTTNSRIIASEEWWKLHNIGEERKETNIGKDGGFASRAGWLHNVVTSKHADAMEAYPEPNILPREASDRAEATLLSSIIPCILEQNKFEAAYSDACWQKCKTGTGVYKIVWDPSKLNGLGDIGIETVNLLNLYWEPGVRDVQKSRYFFQVEMQDRDILMQQYPGLADDVTGKALTWSKFLYDDTVDTTNKAAVVEVYYHKYVNGRKTLQYCKYVDDIVLESTENSPEQAERGLYDHALYPYVFDVLFPIEGSPCGYGYIDICKNPQTAIDLLKTSFIQNAMVASKPRYFKRGGDSGVNEEEFLDLSKPIVHVEGTIDDTALRPIDANALPATYINIWDRMIEELRETSGNTETSTGNIASGVTAASAIAALQEASGKGSRDSTLSSYRAYGDIVLMCIELMRQFYDMPRQFRIVGQYGMERYISYSNANLQPIDQGSIGGTDLGYRLPTFDVKIYAQKKSVYTKVAQNEMVMQFFRMGFFNPQMTDQTLLCLELMDFEGKDEIMQKVSRNGTMYEKLIQYMQLALMLAQKAAPEMVDGLSQDIMQTMGASSVTSAVPAQMMQSDHIKGTGDGNESTRVSNAREATANASQPNENKAVKGV